MNQLPKSSLFSTFHLFAAFALPGMMPEQISSRYLIEQGFIPFQEPADSFTPLFASMSVNGAPASGPGSEQVAQIFKDSTWAIIPEGMTIQKLKNQAGQEVWNYPIGTEVAHEILFNDSDHTVFELRMIRKVSDAQWDFASYSPAVSSKRNVELKRNHYVGLGAFSTTVQLVSGKVTKLDIMRINLKSCQNCHFMNSPAFYQYQSLAEAGPCGFTPQNESGIKGWFEAYREKYGHSPFSE